MEALLRAEKVVRLRKVGAAVVGVKKRRMDRIKERCMAFGDRL